jgi:indole-3-glycerol phosphate synthase
MAAAGDILKRITEQRRADAAELAGSVPIEELKARAASRVHHSLRHRLEGRFSPRIIAETKKASPSAGVLIRDYDPAKIAHDYSSAGACGISVLTEPRHFCGDLEHLRSVRKKTDLPLLRKDFLCTRYHVAEAAAWGADAVLLIVASLGEEELRGLYQDALELGLDVLVEAHTPEEVETALSLDEAIIGINSRNLKTLKTDLKVARSLTELIPSDRLSVAESGIRTANDVRSLEALGYNGFLIGESFLRTGDPGKALAGLMKAVQQAARGQAG